MFYFVLTLTMTFLFTVLMTRGLIPRLRSIKMGQKILEIGPRWHKSKEGTPTMGGLSFLLATLFVTLTVGIYVAVNGRFGDETKLFLVLGMALLNGLIGLIDDFTKFVKKQNEGLTAKQKYLLQLGVAILFLAVMRRLGYARTAVEIPFFHVTWELGPIWYGFAALLITGMVNSVNLTDGIDGLASSVTFVVAAFFAVLSFSMQNFPGVYTSALVLGSCLGFLIYNFYPAKIFMGDTGSLFLGGMVTGIALVLDQPLILLLVGIMYVMESVSVILQVMVYKLTPTHRRLFRMAPIHHHFEQCGWSELKIVFVFSGITVLASLLAWIGLH